jgi:uncharacterized membrane protein
LKWNTRFIAQAGIIAALYAALVIIVTLTPARYISFGNIQLRFSEALTTLPYFTLAAIPGLFAGCLISNVVGTVSGAGLGMLDIIFGSLATLAAAYCSYLLRRWKWLVPLPPVVINALIVGLLLTYAYGVKLPLAINILTVGAGQALACYGLGMPLLYALEKRRGIFQ